MKVGVAVLDSPSLIYYSPCGLCGRKATLNSNSDFFQSSGAVTARLTQSLIVLVVSVDVKQH